MPVVFSEWYASADVEIADDVLRRHHLAIEAGIADVRSHLMKTEPDLKQLGPARLRLIQASSARSRYVRDVLVPRCKADGDALQRAELDTMLRRFSEKRLASSAHITTWTNTAIARDWSGYRKGAQLILGMMEEQISRERLLFG